MSEQLTIKTPGKLMVAGEFAVLEPGHSLIVMAVDRFVYATISDAKRNKLSLTDFELLNLDWSYTDKKIQISNRDSRISFVAKAMGVTLTYLSEIGVDVTPFSLSIKSELNDKSGLKYGLGSSAAVVTAVVSAILQKFIEGNPDEEVIFKLASIAHVSVQGNGSCADVAASTYCGILHYSAFQADSLLDMLHSESCILRIVESEWEYLSVERVSFPKSLELCIGWTGAPASTGSLVSQIRKLKSTNRHAYENFLSASDLAVEAILFGMKHNSAERFLSGIEKNRIALSNLGQVANVIIETEQLRQLSVEAKQLDGAGKLSGAGGGDCGIAFVDTMAKAETLKHVWNEKGIKVLNMNAYTILNG